jgi:D-sedoheptulose 7-phosphate isomerase
MKEKMIANLKKYAESVKCVCDNLPLDDIAQMVEIIWTACQERKVIYTMGNGGHSNTASHMINDLAKHTTSSDDKKSVVGSDLRFRTLCLNDSMSFVTGIANDMGFENIFAEQLANWIQPGDVVICLSGSGNSKNILQAIQIANEHGATSICMTGFKGGKAKDVANLTIVVPIEKMVMVEDFHLMIAHMVADELKRKMQNREDISG